MATVSRNAPCPCGSGKKYKHCHLGKPADPVTKSSSLLGLVPLALVGVGLGVYFALYKSVGLGLSVGVGALIVVGLFALLRNPPPPGKGGDPGAINFGS